MSLGVGLGLAAACGFRIFLPLLALAVASRADVEWILAAVTAVLAILVPALALVLLGLLLFGISRLTRRTLRGRPAAP